MSLELGTLNIGQVGRLQKERSALCHSDLLQTQASVVHCSLPLNGMKTRVCLKSPTQQ